MNQKTYTTDFDIHLPATANEPERFVETIEVEVFRNFGEVVLNGTPDKTWGDIVLKTQQVTMACIESSKQDGARVEL